LRRGSGICGVDGNRYNRPGLAGIPKAGKSELNQKPVNPQHLDHAVRTGLVSAALIGINIGILYGLTHLTDPRKCAG
jgi:hypothetical protein